MVGLLELVVLAAAGLFFLLLLAGLALVVRDTLRQKGGFGIATRLPHCARCGTKVPAVRLPANTRQAMWGGCTCAECGCELDKYGNVLVEPPRDRIPADADRRFGEREAPGRGEDRIERRDQLQ